jgi:hypothetical protein
MSHTLGLSAAPPAERGDIQRNLLRILLVTSRAWGLASTTHETRRRAPRWLLPTPLPAHRSARAPHVAHITPPGLRWAW